MLFLFITIILPIRCGGLFCKLARSFPPRFQIIFQAILFIPRRYGVIFTGRTVIVAGREIAPTGREIILTGRKMVTTGREKTLTGRRVILTGREVALTGRGVILHLASKCYRRAETIRFQLLFNHKNNQQCQEITCSRLPMPTLTATWIPPSLT